MAEFIQIITRDSKLQNEGSQTIENYNKKSYATQSKLWQNAWSKVESVNKPKL